MKTRILIAAAVLAVGTVTPVLGQDAGPRSGARPQRQPQAQPVDPDTNEVLQHIKAAVEPTEEQWGKIIARYEAFIQEQRQAMRGVMRSQFQRGGEPGRRGAGGQGGEPGQRGAGGQGGEPGRRGAGGQSGEPGRRGAGEQEGEPGRRGSGGQTGEPGQQRQGRGGVDRAAMMETVNKALEPINALYLRDTKAILTEDQHLYWDACIADLDLAPAFGRGAGAGGGRGAAMDPRTGPSVGDEAPKFELQDIDGETVSLDSLLGKPVVIEFGSYTCPVFRRQVESIESLHEEFGDQVNWVLIYTKEAHPTDGWAIDINSRSGIELAQHTSIEDRFECARICDEKMDLSITVLVDGFDDKVAKAYAGHPNRGFVVDAEGTVVSQQVWINAEQTSEVLRGLLEIEPADEG